MDHDVVDRRVDLSHDEFIRSYCIPRRPVIFENAIGHWPATHRWTPEYFVERVGDKRVVVDGSAYTVRQLVDLIANSSAQNPAPYLRAQKLVDVFPELAGDLEPPMAYSLPNWAESHMLPPSIRRTRLHEILLGGSGAGFHVLHYDKDHLHAFIAQLYGEKEFFAFAPDQTPYLYPKKSSPNQSQVDIFDPDLDRHPDFEKADQIRVTLGPGEAIFMPPGWWHTTRMPGASISVTWNMVNGTNWSDFTADTETRVRAHTNGAVAGVFRAFAAVFEKTKRQA
jgi:histone arginine demethylase JMJD6